MSASAQTRPDERYKREQCFRCPERARISWGRAMRRRVRGRDLSLSRSGQRHIDAPWPRKFNQGPYVPEHVLDIGDQSRRVTTLWLPVLQAHRQGEKAAMISRKPNVGVGITDRPDGLVKGAVHTGLIEIRRVAPSRPASAIIGFARGIRRQVFRALPASSQPGSRGY